VADLVLFLRRRLSEGLTVAFGGDEDGVIAEAVGAADALSDLAVDGAVEDVDA
jgi:hypothetical protein